MSSLQAFPHPYLPPPSSSSSPPVSRTLSSKYKSIHNFNLTNQSRSLTTSQTSEIHFVNVEDPCEDLVNSESRTDVFIKKDIISSSKGKAMSIQSTSFSIPTLPEGLILTFEILSTWGDPYYVGLMGIDIFDGTGHPVLLNDISRQIIASPPDINILPEYSDDPRTVDNLMDGVNHTTDDLHAWLAPFTPGGTHTVKVKLNERAKVSMIRIWNYNKSRIHSYRGVRYVEIKLDGDIIFKGEVKRAAGEILQDSSLDSVVNACSECILFTMDETILNVIEKYDKHLNVHEGMERQTEEAAVRPQMSVNTWTNSDGSTFKSRPSTACGRKKKKKSKKKTNPGDADVASPSFVQSDHLSLIVGGQRSQMHHVTAKKTLTKQRSFVAPTEKGKKIPMRPSTAPMRRQWQGQKGRHLEMVCRSNWGGQDLVLGLTGLEFLDSEFNPIPMQPSMISVMTPHDNVMIDPLINQNNITQDVRNMWVVDVESMDSEVVVHVDFGEELAVGGLKVWNFNAGLEESYLGVKRMTIFLDGKQVSPMDGFLIRKAPGYANFDFGQFIALNSDNEKCKGEGDGASVVMQGSNSVEDLWDVASSMSKISPVSSPSKYKKKSKNGSHEKPGWARSYSADNAEGCDDAELQRMLDQMSNNSSSPTHGGVHNVGDFALNPLDSSLNSSSSLEESAASIALLSVSNMHFGGGLGVGTCGVPQQYETPLFPSGCIIKIIIFSTHGDPFYVGLNGLEFYDSSNKKVLLSEENVTASPADINVLDETGKSNDPRTLDKLYDGKNATYDDFHMWLAPFRGPDRGSNTIYIFFDELVSISRMTIWNYSKTSTRGVKEFEVLIDDSIIYRGNLKKAYSEASTHSDPQKLHGQTVLFTNDKEVIMKEKDRIYIAEEEEIDGPVFFDEGSKLEGGDGEGANRPQTAARRRRD
ncbi:hypothetical protein TL16_g01506 [Triparma laevis f. inornata]|uniref:KATNIP domain-containing protein n=1 Tax=Triparma laevis f. inornata TaxID=1714386 RepID=A0A9W7DSQ2_9STRA|nr:hypothetical protein TL16_g01506 [Triparma laevis f. inornata]